LRMAFAERYGVSGSGWSCHPFRRFVSKLIWLI
jgi:hypothetical protein